MPIADLDAALGSVARIFLDSSTLIAFHSPLEQAHPLAVHLLGRISNEQDSLLGYYSVVSAAELLVRPLRSSAADYAFMHDFLLRFPNLTVLPVDLHVAQEAAVIRAMTRLALPDALIVASALLAGCEAVVSNDAQWQRRLGPLFSNFRWVYLSNYL